MKWLAFGKAVVVVLAAYLVAWYTGKQDMITHYMIFMMLVHMYTNEEK